MDKNTARRIKQIHDAAMSSSREQECTSCSPSNFLLDQHGSPKPGISSFQLIRVRKKKKGHGSRKVFIFSKTYKENFVFLRGGETRGKAETSGKDSTITTSRCFFGGRDLFWDRDENDDEMSQGDLSDVSGQRYCARKWPAGTSNESNIGRKSCDLSFCFRLYCSRLSNRQPCCVVARR